MDFKFSQKSLELQEKMNKFFEEHIFPNEEAYEKAKLIKQTIKVKSRTNG